MSETLFTFLISAATAVALRALSQRGWQMPATVGTLIGLATLVRPVSYFLALPVALLLGTCGGRNDRRAKERLAVMLSALAPALLIVGGWQVRNYARTGHAEFSQVTGEIALLSRGAAIVARRDGLSFSEARRELDEQTRPPGADRAEVARLQRERGFAIVRDHLRLFAQTQVKRAVRMMCGPGEHRLAWLLGHPTPDAPGLDLLRLPFPEFFRKWFWNPSWPLALFLFAFAYLAAFDLGILYWLLRSVRARSIGATDIFLWSIIGYFLATGMASSRFRVPIMPLLSAYAAQGLTAFFQTRSRTASTASTGFGVETDGC